MVCKWLNADNKKIQAENNKKIKAHQAKLAKQKADKKEAKRQNDAIDKIANASDKANRPKLARNAYKARLNQVEIGRLKQKQKIDAENAKAKAKKLAAKKAADKKEQDRLDKQKKQKKIQSAYKKTVAAVLSSRKRKNNSGL